MVSLYSQIHGMSQLEALRELAGELGVPNSSKITEPIQTVQERPAEPAPADVALPPEHPRHGGVAAAAYRYLDAAGLVLFVVCRYASGAGKAFAQYHWRAGQQRSQGGCASPPAAVRAPRTPGPSRGPGARGRRREGPLGPSPS